jgi:hypothetical protein
MCCIITPAKAGVQLRPARCWTPAFGGVVVMEMNHIWWAKPLAEGGGR